MTEQETATKQENQSETEQKKAPELPPQESKISTRMMLREAKSKLSIVEIPDMKPHTEAWYFWCREYGFRTINSPRRAWHEHLKLYLQDADTLICYDGKPIAVRSSHVDR